MLNMFYSPLSLAILLSDMSIDFSASFLMIFFFTLTHFNCVQMSIRLLALEPCWFVSIIEARV